MGRIDLENERMSGVYPEGCGPAAVLGLLPLPEIDGVATLTKAQRDIPFGNCL
jgi:hypothetical protein